MDPAFTASYVGLVIWTWDWIGNFRAEYDLIWSHRLRDLRASQLLYFTTRYSALPCIGVSIVFQHFRKNHQSEIIAPDICRQWLHFTIVTIGWNFALILSNLMLRVYALYRLDRRVILAHIFLLSIKVANVLSWSFFFLPNQKFSATCAPIVERPLEIATWLMIELGVQAIPVCVIISKGGKIEQLTRERRTINLMVYLRREGVLSWSATTIFSVASLIIAVTPRKNPDEVGDAAQMTSYPLFITLSCWLGCQLFFYMRRPLKEDASSVSTSDNPSLELDLLDSTGCIQPIGYDIEDVVVSTIGETGSNAAQQVPQS